MHLQKYLLIIFLLIRQSGLHAQQQSFVITQSGDIGIQTAAPLASLDMRTTKTGLLLPGFTTAQIKLIQYPVQGMIVYDKTVQKTVYFKGSEWQYSDGSGLAYNTVEGSVATTGKKEKDGWVWNGQLAAFVKQNESEGDINTGKVSSVALDLSTTTRGFLPSAMSYDSIKNIRNPAAGTLVYNTTDHVVMIYNGSSWILTDGRITNQHQWETYEIADIKKESPDAIRAIPSPKKGTMVYNTAEERIVYYNGQEWVFLNGRKMDYKVGDAIEDGIVFYIKNNNATGSHGLLVRNTGYTNVYYSFDLLFSTGSFINTGDGMEDGLANKAKLLGQSINEFTQGNFEEFYSHFVTRWYWSNYWKPENEYYAISIADLNTKLKNDKGLVYTKTVKEILSENTTNSNIEWFIPSIDQLLQFRTSFFGNENKFSFMNAYLNGQPFVSSSNMKEEGGKNGYVDIRFGTDGTNFFLNGTNWKHTNFIRIHNHYLNKPKYIYFNKDQRDDAVKIFNLTQNASYEEFKKLAGFTVVMVGEF